MSWLTGAPASLARALGFHDLMNGTARNPAPTAPTTAVVAVRNRRLPRLSGRSSTPSLPIRHSARTRSQRPGIVTERESRRQSGSPRGEQSAVPVGEHADALDVALGLGVGRHALVLVHRPFARVVAGGCQPQVAVETLQQPRQVLDP